MIGKYLYGLATDEDKGIFAAIVKFPLYLISLVYGLLVRFLVFVYQLKPRHLACKVISVGNITLGGTGKTSLVLLIAGYLKGQGRQVAIITRGYKRKKGSGMGDEPAMLKIRLKDIPVIVDADRIRAAGKAIRDYAADTVIFDDGFQQWRIAKDLEIVTLDASRPFGNGKLLPRGVLREPLTCLKRADVFILAKTNLYSPRPQLKAFLGGINPRALIIESAHSPTGFCQVDKSGVLLASDAFRGKDAVLFSGIADPASFEQLIRQMGINIALSLRFSDHHNYSEKDLADIASAARKENIDILITTEKDAARIKDLDLAVANLPLFYLRVEIKLTENEQGFYHRLLRLYSA